MARPRAAARSASESFAMPKRGVRRIFAPTAQARYGGEVPGPRDEKRAPWVPARMGDEETASPPCRCWTKMKECFALPNSLQRLTAPDDSRKSAGVMPVIWNERAIPADKSAAKRMFLIAKHRGIRRLALTVLSARWEHRRRLRRERAPARAVRTVVAQEPRIGRNAHRFAVVHRCTGGRRTPCP